MRKHIESYHDHFDRVGEAAFGCSSGSRSST